FSRDWSSDVCSSDLLPAAADGQMRIRVANTVETPLTANVLVLESRATGSSGSRTVFVSCDLVTIPTELRDLVRQSVARRVPDLRSEERRVGKGLCCQ